METKTKMLAVALLALLTFGLTSCNNDEPKPNQEEVKTLSFESKSYTNWVYVSLKEGKIVNVAPEEAGNNLDWDMGFLRFKVRTNGGKSGMGKAAVMATNFTSLEDVTSLPAGEFVEDDIINVMTSGAMPPSYTQTPGSDVLDWAHYDKDAGKWIFNNKVFILRTATGEYAKLVMKSYLDANGTSGTVTFDYVFPFLPKK